MELGHQTNALPLQFGEQQKYEDIKGWRDRGRNGAFPAAQHRASYANPFGEEGDRVHRLASPRSKLSRAEQIAAASETLKMLNAQTPTRPWMRHQRSLLLVM